MTTLEELQLLIAQGDAETLEFKRSTAELRRAGETLCGFLNTDGGQVLIGVAPNGCVVSQQVADITLREEEADALFSGLVARAFSGALSA